MATPSNTAHGGAELPRRLGLLDSTALLVGSVIGSGIFVVPSLIAKRIPEPGLVLAIWIFSGLLVLCGALVLAELGVCVDARGKSSGLCFTSITSSRS